MRDIALLDANADLAAGQALDLLHGASLMADQVITSGGYEHIPDSDLICITAGLRRKPDESRLDLINRNVDLFLSILGEIASVGHQAATRSCWSCRTRSTCSRTWPPSGSICRRRGARSGNAARYDPLPQLIAAALAAPPTQVTALILGEHGDSMVPIWSSATIGRPAAGKIPGLDAAPGQRAVHAHQGLGAEVIKKKGGAGFAVGLAIQEVIESIALDRRAILPVSQRAERLLRNSRRGAVRADGRRSRRSAGDTRDRAVAEGSASSAQERPGASRRRSTTYWRASSHRK